MPDEEPQPWNGIGLPPAARERLARAADAQVATSLLSVPDAAALAEVGFAPVGEVMGCIVEQVGWQGFGCDMAYGWNTSRTVTSGTRSRWAGLSPYVEALYRGWDTALRRLLEEARLLGADGVVGIRLSDHHLGSDNLEFVALGTAVRGHGPGRASVPFTTELAGADVAKLLHAGWVPTGIAVGIAAAVRHDDYRTQQQRWRWQANTEIDGYTDLVQTVRHDARTQFERRARNHGGEAVLVSDLDLHVWEREVSDNHTDHYARARFVGTAATSFRRAPADPTSSLSILPLGRPKETRR
ncbi:heavy metal-binding domain-containing protein [Nocardioides sp. BP30]|uniref:heavy metal-binding domain-containing protein n=1 Tax=Nocardioides sp. BP30 TaxID=3036374 RepID=UPI0024694A4B|nr:heavy metal-binding domain-containing protein [Nocardioides sp. BP30]WGL50710.1 heavy metal-binding domain-containing protein [Nocardioides sp. BP30]